MKKRIVIEEGKIKVENKDVADVIAELILALVKVVKASGLPRRALFEAVRSAWRNTKAKDVD